VITVKQKLANVGDLIHAVL